MCNMVSILNHQHPLSDNGALIVVSTEAPVKFTSVKTPPVGRNWQTKNEVELETSVYYCTHTVLMFV